MTGAERAELQLLADFVRDWRREDKEWKTETDKRLRAVEGFVTGVQAERRAATRAAMSRRQKVAAIFAALGVLGSTALGLINYFTQ